MMSIKNTAFPFTVKKPQPQRQQEESFEELEATELYCSQCGRAVPVRRFLLLILPEGDKYEYRCRFCGSKVGGKTVRSGQFQGILRD
ncbi:MAG: hypothetical protein V2J25_01225 [Desulfatiglans sp.]|jgi:DNA-directed RNA polymerase subunit RPC12/RpoP|nr:cytoplasmic protein [Thermodesulfobacteriota bacterium]MEE4351467.1 hypothetical protein [Desulfatiglans sp.]